MSEAASLSAESDNKAPRREARTAAILFVLGLALYAATRLVALRDFPIFFFCDEAVQANAAKQLFENHFRDRDGVLLPPYFLNDQRWAMSLNVYLLVAPIVALGKTILVTRGTFAAVSLFGAAALGLALRTAGVGLWWTAPFLLGILPVDFLHSRMALETTPGFFAGFLGAYLLYRLRSPRYLFLAMLLGAMTFYSYTAGQGIMLVTGLLLLLVDARYHMRQSGRLWLAALVFALLLAVPFAREQRRHPNSTREQLLVLHSYWIEPTPLAEKLRTFAHEYAWGFDPRYWFVANEAELVRHRMDGMAYVPMALAPLVAIGIASCLWRFFRSPGHRAILLCLPGVPFAAAMHHRQILRVLPMVVPVVLLAAVGLAEVFRLLGRLLPERALLASLLAVLVAAQARLTLVALQDGPLWYRDYGLYGMQYGARQIFDGIREDLRRFPDTQVLLTSSWANNPDEFLDFFLDGEDRRRARMAGIETYLLYRTPLADRDLFVLTAPEYAKARKDPKLVVSRPVRMVPYPDGAPGFFFVRIRYSADADALFAAEREARRRLEEATVSVGGREVRVRHSMIDMGQASSLFDGRADSTFRGLEANPFLLEFDFPEPRSMARIDLLITRMDCDIRIEVTPAGGRPPFVVTRSIRGQSGDSLQAFPFPSGSTPVAKIHVEILEPGMPEPAHIEIRDVFFG